MTAPATPEPHLTVHRFGRSLRARRDAIIHQPGVGCLGGFCATAMHPEAFEDPWDDEREQHRRR